MKRLKFAIGLLAICIAALAVFFVLRSEHALLTHPKGVIAESELNLIVTQICLMLIVIVPTFLLLFIIVAKRAKHDPDHSYGKFGELMLWGIPSIVIAVMAVITWKETHKLDPFRPLQSELKPLEIQVVALDWKWVFIYPELGIATMNFVQFPERTPIHFTLAADGSPMNSFWIPQLSGQIYAMSGMATQLHMMANGPGVYAGRAAEINGEGYADMTFTAESTSQSDFESWVTTVKESPLQLTDPIYHTLIKPSKNDPVALYSFVEKDLFHKVVMKYMEP